MSVSYDIKIAAQEVLQALDLSPILPVNVQVRKLPAHYEAIDTLPMLIICNSERPEDNVPVGFKTFNVTYFLDFVVISAGNKERVTGLQGFDEIRQKIRKAFDAPHLTGAGTVWNTKYIPTTPYDRRKFSQNYDYAFTTIQFESQEF